MHSTTKRTFKPIYCAECGILVEPTGGGQKFCRECAKRREREADRQRQKKKRAENPLQYRKHGSYINCHQCGKSIVFKGGNHRFCDDCRVERERAAQRARKKRAYHRDPEKFKERRKEWGRKNKEWVLAKNYEWRTRNADKYRQAIENWRRNNPEKCRKAWRDYRERNLDYHRERVKEYQRKHPEKVREWARRRYVRKKGAEGSHTDEQFWELCLRYGWKCAYCGRKLTKETVTRDHIIPLSRGGSDNIENIAPSCLACNAGKKDRTPWEYGVGWPRPRNNSRQVSQPSLFHV